MSTDVRALEPTTLWNHFADLNAIPRASKKEEQVIEFMRQFGESLGLATTVDDVGNVVIRKPASEGLEDRPTVVLQSHLDMVHQKNADTQFDFDTQGIEMFVDDDWVRAKGTTLGADNGLGVASIMTLLSSDDVPHPPLEALFTIDEETGMTGAQGLAGGVLTGKYLLNLDTEDDNEITIGCAGGIDVTATATYEAENAADGQQGFQIEVKGLTGGHSGMDIHLGRANANKCMNRILWSAARKFGARIHRVDGGGLRNAIPRESTATINIPDESADAFADWAAATADDIRKEYNTTDPDTEIQIIRTDAAGTVLPVALQSGILSAIYACPNGIHRLSPDMEDLVQTSNNLARVLIENGEVTIMCLTRSASNTEKLDLAAAIQSTFELAGADIKFSGDYPGWIPAPSSDLVGFMSNLYREVFGSEPAVLAGHGGLECGILGQNYPDMEMISFGPNIRGAHSPDECAQVSSLQKFWLLLTKALEKIQ